MLIWQKSTFSGGGDGDHCIEVAEARQTTVIREGDEPGLTLATTPAAMAALIRHVKRTG